MIEVACLLRGGKEPDGRFLGFDKEDLIRFGGEDRRAGGRDDIRRRFGPEERGVGT